MRHLRFLTVLAAMMLIVAACSSNAASQAPASQAPTSQAPASQAPASQAPTDPDHLVIGFVPSTEAGQLVEDIKPLADYLTQQLGIPVEGIVTNDYAGLVTAMQGDNPSANIGALPPYGLVQAVDVAGAKIILQSERFGSGTYHTQFFTNVPDKYCTVSPAVDNTRVVSDADVTYLNCNGTARANSDTPEGPIGLEALSAMTAGTNVSFVSASSASGFIFPAVDLLNAGLDAGNFTDSTDDDIKALFAGSHDASVIAVCEGQAEVGVSFDDARTIATSDCDIPGKVVVFAYGSEIPNDGIAVSHNLSDALTQKIKDALMAYAETEEGAAVLDSIYQITAFTEPNLDALQIVRDAVEKLGYSG